MAFQTQPPFTTPDCMNVQSVDVVDERGRGGSRPGIQRTHAPLANQIDMLAEVTVARVEGDARTIYQTTLDGGGFSADWTALFAGLPGMTKDSVFVGAADGKRGALLADQQPQTAFPAAVEIFISPFGATYNGQTHSLIVAAQSTSLFEEFALTLTGGDYVLLRNGAQVATGTTGILSGWFRVEYTGANAKVIWCGRQLLTIADLSTAGTRVGFALAAVTDTVALAMSFRHDYYSRDPGTGYRNQLVCASGGDLYRETFPGIWEVVPALASADVVEGERLRAVAQLQRLWIADHGRVAGGEVGTLAAGVLTALDEDSAAIDWTTLGITIDMRVILTNGVGTEQGVYGITNIAAGGLTLAPTPTNGTTAWRVVRAPKVYDPITNRLSVWSVSEGTYPAGCRLIARYRDRIVLAGDPVSPHLWYMSRQGNAQDFNYGASDLDVQRAVAGQSSDAGAIGDAITALIPHSDDYLVVGCASSLWVIRGDPAYGGQIDALSRTVGVVGPDAWAAAPDGGTWFVAPNGVYVIPPGAQGLPIPVSKRLPQEFQILGGRDVQCSWDHQAEGLRIFIDGYGAQGAHWLVKDGAFWPLTIPYTQEPTALLSLPPRPLLDGPLLLGGRDGAVRRFEPLAPTDDGVAFNSSVTIGPFRLAGSEGQDGMISTVRTALDPRLAGVTVGVAVGKTAQSPAAVASWSAESDTVRTYRPRARGHSGQITMSSNTPWAFESLAVGVERKGVRRP